MFMRKNPHLYNLQVFESQVLQDYLEHDSDYHDIESEFEDQVAQDESF